MTRKRCRILLYAVYRIAEEFQKLQSRYVEKYDFSESNGVFIDVPVSLLRALGKVREELAAEGIEHVGRQIRRGN